TNPKWCQPLSVWKNYFSQWIYAPDPAELLNATIFFDFRSGFGDYRLARELRRHLNEKAQEKDMFLFHLARQCMSTRVPLSFFKSFIVNKDGEHKNHLDIKRQGLTPFVNFARVLALKNGISETNTLARLKALYDAEFINRDIWSAANDAYELQMQQRLIHQLSQIEKGVLPDNHINPEQLSELERRMLKDAFTVIERLYSVLDKMYPVA
ncbi:MAG: histidine kinase, partial [Desulfocapsa sp.]|nr:histidine kinase [Desulfocapsa sp.]